MKFYHNIDFYVQVFLFDETNQKNDYVIHDEQIEDIDQILNELYFDFYL